MVAAEGREDGIVLRDPAIFAPSNVEVAPTTTIYVPASISAGKMEPNGTASS